MNAPLSLRQQLARSGMIVVPGAYDAIGATLIEQAGFEAVYMTGAGTSLARGYPDLGLLTMTEMVDTAGTIARAVHIPLIADADTGFGNELNVTRCVREYESRGVAAIQIEDQVMPKRCGHVDGKEIIPREDWIAKIRAAIEARRSPEFLLVARTDARALVGLDEAIWRANAALDAGADIAFVEAPQSLAEIEEIPRRVHGPCLLNMVPGGKSPISDLRLAETMGYRITILPGLLLKATIAAGDACLAELKRSGMAPASDTSVARTFDRFGAADWESKRRRLVAATPR